MQGNQVPIIQIGSREVIEYILGSCYVCTVAFFVRDSCFNNMTSKVGRIWSILGMKAAEISSTKTFSSSTFSVYVIIMEERKGN